MKETIFVILYVGFAFLFPVPSHGFSSGRLSSVSYNKSDKIKVIIDTDAGSDDAVAIIVAVHEMMKRDDVEIIAITCVAGNTELANVEINVLKTLHTLNATHIPVYAGANGSLIITPPPENYFGFDGFGDFDYPNPPSREEIQKELAVYTMLKLVKKYPSEITILALGPMTNLALATRLEPTFLNLVKDIYTLGDWINQSPTSPTFNFATDPESAFIVFNSTDDSAKGVLNYLPKEARYETPIEKEWRINVLGKLNTSLVDFINKVENKVLLSSDHKRWTCGDGMLVALALRPQLGSDYQKHHGDILLNAGDRTGVVVTDAPLSNSYQNFIAPKHFDNEQFKQMMLEVFG